MSLRQRMLTHLRQHLPALPILSTTIAPGRDRWNIEEQDPDHRLHDHLLTRGQSPEDQVQRIIRTPLPRSGSRWDVHLIHGYTDDRYAVFFRTHHSLHDGAGLVHTLETLFGRADASTLRSSAVVATHAQAHPRPARSILYAVRALARNATKTAVWDDPEHPLSSERNFRWIGVPTDLLRNAARAWNCSVNDVYLAAFARAVSSWAAEHWKHAAGRDIDIAVPLNLRHPREVGAPGVYVAPVRITLPGRPLPTNQLIRCTARATAPLKSGGEREAVRWLTDKIPERVYARLTRFLITPDRATPGVSYVVLRNELRFGQDLVEEVAPLMALPEGCPLTVALTTYRTTSTACFVTDRALPGMDNLHTRWRESVEELARQEPPSPN
ncbi:wax ester/triacylglycerol synthase domain-containing protein [Lentzea xinjiangensis]|nr:wax ester/triacylglycerol synthase domain-containing protein [Lentzea xinjiangensis]